MSQTNHEGAIVGRIQAAAGAVGGLIINSGADHTHTSAWLSATRACS